MIDRFTR